MRRNVFSLVYLTIGSAAAFSQPSKTSQTSPAFEVASIKLNSSGDRSSSSNSNKGEIFIRNSSLKHIIQNAYGVREYSFAGPDWVDSIRFDINAKMPSDYAEDMPREERIRKRQLMLQGLLAERFKLVVHHETRMLPGYALLVAKKGPKLTAAAPGDGRSTNSDDRHLEAQRISMSDLANIVGNQLRCPVADMTGLTAVYDLKLDWSQEEAMPATPGDSNAAKADAGKAR